MEWTTMKVKRPSLSSSISKLYDEMDQLFKVTLNSSSSSRFQWYGAKLKSIILELQAIKEQVRQRKEALPKGKDKGKIYMCFTFCDRYRIEMYESEVEGLERIIAGLAETYMKLARDLQPKLYSYTNNKCSLA